MNPCLACGYRTYGNICDRCRLVTDQLLAGLPTLYMRLEGALMPGAAVGDRVSGGGKTPPLPLRLEPLSLRSHGSIVSVLHSWEDDWREILSWSRRPFRGTIAQSVEGSAKFLRLNWAWCADQHPAPQEFVREMGEITHACRLQIDGPGDSRRIGYCPVIVADMRPCAAALWADPYIDRIKCRGCGTEWPQTSWISLAVAMNA